MKRGEISMEVIIIAAIALLVLVILSVLVIRSGVLFGQASDCSRFGGTCESDASSCLARGESYGVSGHSCGDDGGVCCITTTRTQ